METNIERRDKILYLRAQGKSYSEISKELNCNRSLVAFYCGRRFDMDSQNERESSKEEYEHLVCEAIKQSTNLNQVCKRIGKRGTNTTRKSIERIIAKYNLDTSHFIKEVTPNNLFIKYDDSVVYCKNSAISSTAKIRERLFKDGLKEKRCECCGNDEWLGKPIPLQVHHLNGDNTDNRIENLQILCPNCHAQTDTYCGKAKKKKDLIKPIRKEYAPEREELIVRFKECGSFSGVGKSFGVTDNAVRRWCEKRGLPITRKEMNKLLR